MRDKRIIGMWAGDDWKIRNYAWRGPCARSPLTGENMRAVVARDTRGKYHPGLRNSVGKVHGPEYKTVYEDFTSYGGREKAIGKAQEMLQEKLESHQETRDHLADDAPNRSGVKAEHGSPSIKSLAWEGRVTETDEGRDIHGVVGRTHSGEFKAGLATVYQEHGSTGRVAATRTSYIWQETGYTEKEHAIFAARKEVQNQQSYDRAEPERACSPRPAEKLLASATTPRVGKAARNEPVKGRDRTIDR